MSNQPEIVDGVKVHQWWTQAKVAEGMGKTTRWVQDLEERGLPNRGSRTTKRYPVPHVFIWYTSYMIHTKAYGEVVTWLDFRLAYAEHQLRETKEALEFEASKNGKTTTMRRRRRG